MIDRLNTLCDRAFEALLDAYHAALPDAYHPRNNGGILFPCYRSGKPRISEQELRQQFIEEVRRTYPSWYYSVETPTESCYDFQHGVEATEKGRSARFDLTLYDEQRHPIAFIEFKAHGRTTQPNYEKDFLKLVQTNGVVCRLFVQLFEGFDDTTLNNLVEKKLGPSFNAVPTAREKIACRFYTLKPYNGEHHLTEIITKELATQCN